MQLVHPFKNMMHAFTWILTLSLYVPVFWVLYQSRWRASDYTHAYFILPIFLWLVWRKRGLLRGLLQDVRPGGNLTGLFVMLIGIGTFIFGVRQDYIFFTTLSMVPVLYGLTNYLYGREMTKAVSFPIFYLLFLPPLPIGIVDNITLPMRYGVSVAAEWALSLFYYPVAREGLLLSIGDSELFMGQPCSGFRSAIAMLSLALAYVYVSKSDLLKKGILILFIIPFSLLGNLVRVIALCLITYYLGSDAGQGFFHNFSGIMVFVVTILGLVGLEYFLEKCCGSRGFLLPARER